MRADRPNFGPVSSARRTRLTFVFTIWHRGRARRRSNGRISTAGNLVEIQMSERNGDRGRFQKDRKRKVLRRQRIQELIKAAADRRVPDSIHSPSARGESHIGRLQSVAYAEKGVRPLCFRPSTRGLTHFSGGNSLATRTAMAYEGR